MMQIKLNAFRAPSRYAYGWHGGCMYFALMFSGGHWHVTLRVPEGHAWQVNHPFPRNIDFIFRVDALVHAFARRALYSELADSDFLVGGPAEYLQFLSMGPTFLRSPHQVAHKLINLLDDKLMFYYLQGQQQAQQQAQLMEG